MLVGVEASATAASPAVLGKLMPRWSEIRSCAGTMLRATGVGFFLGLLPGCTPGAISFISYDLERRVSRSQGPEAFWRFQEEELKKYLPLATRIGIRK